jgi:hypothetical protein
VCESRMCESFLSGVLVCGSGCVGLDKKITHAKHKPTHANRKQHMVLWVPVQSYGFLVE